METINGTGKVFDKSKQLADKYFVKMPADLMLYVHVPGYKPEYNYLYTIIVDFYSTKEGYAYPTEWQIARKYGKKDPKTVRGHLRALERVGLIGIYKPFKNKLYVPLEPLPKDELFKACPSAAENYRSYIRKEESEKERQRENIRKAMGENYNGFDGYVSPYN